MPNEQLPVSYPVDPQTTPVRRRAAFSRSTFALINRHAVKDDEHVPGRARRRRVHDESLRLIDDLTSRPIDPLFDDSMLLPQKQSTAMKWVTRILTFVFCVAVGISGCVVVQELHQNTRQKVREELATQVAERTQQQRDLESEVADQRAKIESLTAGQQSSEAGSTTVSDGIVNGTVKVHGEGVTVTLADPIAAEDQKGDLPRDKKGHTIRVVSDADLQKFVSRLWASGAEAIAINDVRLGAQSSIRVAGQSILVGVSAVQSPYRIQAIGDQSAMVRAVNKQNNQTLYDSLAQVGIYPDVSRTREITLDASGMPDLEYAKEVK
ncbi:hypothetical protein Uis1B_2142 [Bifidobacterium margollesii]|uniref:Protein ylxX/ylxW n=1 Tax=Bifidobacterium margollesii TaxID=2020964 RepID=A0A2N5J741_9BIFI|nr:DUF881 domain-containing protein [Bifidobacterium margollesii]PLS30016.1 hypothetical protein Uis1B_2142 [Bifidobacterium margollesii]